MLGWITTHCDVLLLAQKADGPAAPARELDPVKRLQLLSALALVLILGAGAIIFIRATGRLIRWYARDEQAGRFGKRKPLDVDDWANKPLAPPWEDANGGPPFE